jgi:CHAD domain-containing protein
VARAREVPGFDCEEPFGHAAARVIEVRAAEVFDYAAGVLDVGEIERLHDMRVATRRLRAALEVFAACFPAKRHRKALKRVKALSDALGERRDRDVAIEFLSGFASEALEGDQAAITGLIERLRGEQLRANEELAPFLEPKRLRKLRRCLHELAGRAR